tara:strand:+ start:2833 stop:3987 length:1155 start_codon:yes stop_codon:yes gene_type:complete
MALTTARHRWLFQQVADSFGLDAANVEEMAKDDPSSTEAIVGFLGSSAPPRLMAYYQPAYSKNEKGDWAVRDDTKRLVFTVGEEEGLLDKCIYFVRTETAASIDLAKVGDGAIMSGEIGRSALQDFDACLSHVYRPLLESRGGWGKAGEEQTREFLGDMTRFLSEIKDSLKSIVGGLELRKPEKRFSDMETGRVRRDDPELLAHYEELLGDWCEKIETYLDEAPESSSFENNKDEGPMSELDYWRRRMQRLTNITEQIKTKECKIVVSALSAVAKNQSDQSRGPYSLLRRWKQIDVNITEAANEAKDNEKYLRTLEKFIEVRRQSNKSSGNHLWLPAQLLRTMRCSLRSLTTPPSPPSFDLCIQFLLSRSTRLHQSRSSTRCPH